VIVNVLALALPIPLSRVPRRISHLLMFLLLLLLVTRKPRLIRKTTVPMPIAMAIVRLLTIVLMELAVETKSSFT
jgi:hypothetical protein